MNEAIKMSVQVDKNLASIKKVVRSVVTEVRGQICMLVVNSILVSHMILYSQNKSFQREFWGESQDVVEVCLEAHNQEEVVKVLTIRCKEKSD